MDSADYDYAAAPSDTERHDTSKSLLEVVAEHLGTRDPRAIRRALLRVLCDLEGDQS